MEMKLHPRLLLYLIISFIAATIIGTLSHECGHILAARMLGYHSHFGFGYMYVIGQDNVPYKDQLIISIAGPLQTILTGTIAFCILQFYHRRHAAMNSKKWLLVFFSLFWLRPVANFSFYVAKLLFRQHFIFEDDENFIAGCMHLPQWSILAVTALIGLIVLAVTIFRYIPRQLRFTFILSGLIGGIAGFFTWLVWLGPVLMP